MQMGDHERSKSRALRFVNFEIVLYV